MSILRRYFDKTNCMYFLIKDEYLFYKYNEIREKVIIKILFKKTNRELIYNK